MNTFKTFPLIAYLFQKLALCRGLQFAFPTRINEKDVLASFERTYRVLEPNLVEKKKELTAATLRSIALNYIERKGHLHRDLYEEPYETRQGNWRSSDG